MLFSGCFWMLLVRCDTRTRAVQPRCQRDDLCVPLCLEGWYLQFVRAVTLFPGCCWLKTHPNCAESLRGFVCVCCKKSHLLTHALRLDFQVVFVRSRQRTGMEPSPLRRQCEGRTQFWQGGKEGRKEPLSPQSPWTAIFSEQ